MTTRKQIMETMEDAPFDDLQMLNWLEDNASSKTAKKYIEKMMAIYHENVLA